MTFIIVLMGLFIVKHFVCDFLLQTDTMIKQKGSYGASGGVVHAAIHAAGTVVILFVALPWTPLAHIAATALAVLDGIVHYHIDWAKAKISTRWNLHSAHDKQFWWLMGLDQMLHYLTYLGLTAMLVLL